MTELNELTRLSKEIRDIESLEGFLVKFFEDDVEIHLVGSRATENNLKSSDIDIVINSKRDIRDKITLLRFAIEESNLPQKVDIIYLPDAPYFQEIV